MSDIITQTALNQLQTLLYNTIRGLNSSIPPAILTQVINEACRQITPSLTQGVSTNTNRLLDTIPTQTIGIKNPVDLVTGVLGSREIASNLNTSIVQALAPKTTTSLVTNIISLLRQQLPPGQLESTNFSTLQKNLINAVNPDVENTVSDTLSNIVNSLFEYDSPVSDTFTNLDDKDFFATAVDVEYPEDLDTALEQIDLAHATGLVSEQLNACERFNVKESSNQEKLQVLEHGFTDPEANYPTSEYAGRAETNKLATEDVNGTIVQKKDLERMKGAKLPGGEAWDQPPSPYRARYPYNKVTQTESGHVIEVDDTPGSERLHIYHRSGTFVEIDANGSVVKRASGSSYEIVDRNGKIAIAGKADISVNGACNIYVGNDANIEVDGDTNLTCHNDITAQAGGTFNLSAVEEFNITSTNVNIEAYHNLNIKTGEKYYLYSGQDMHVYTAGNYKFQALQSSYSRVGVDSFYEIVGSMHNKAGGDVYNDGNNINFTASGDFNIDSTTMYMNSNTSTPAQSSIDSVRAGPSNIGIITGRKDIVVVSIEDPVALTLGDNFKLEAEEGTETESEINQQKELLIGSGLSTREELEELPVITEQETVTSSQTKILTGDRSLLKVKNLPGNYKLSPNFTVEMLSSKAAVSSYKIPDVTASGLNYGEVVFNLHLLALNVLEPILALYPNMIVTSGFRLESASKTSQHLTGQAADIQFKGVVKSEYYNIAKKLAKVITYDQFLLEYSAAARNPWLHISFVDKSKGTNRLQCLTLNNHRTFTQGFSNLA